MALERITKSDLQRFLDYLEGNIIRSLDCALLASPGLTREQSMKVVMYLQDYMKLLPEGLVFCDHCHELIDDDNGEGVLTKDTLYCKPCAYMKGALFGGKTDE